MSSRRKSLRCWITCNEVEPMTDRIRRLEQAIAEAVKLAPPQMQEGIQSLQALRGIAQISAITLVAELGEISRFEGARQLMGYSGAVPSEDSSGKRIQRGPITKTGNTHLRRIAIEAAWAYRHRPAIGMALRKRQEGLSEEVKEIAWKAQHRLNKRYRTLTAAGKEAESRNCGRARAAGLYLGHRSSGGTKPQTSGINKRTKHSKKGKLEAKFSERNLRIFSKLLGQGDAIYIPPRVLASIGIIVRSHG